MTNVKKKLEKKYEKNINSRLIFLSAIIFFLFLSLVLKLYKIQILNFDVYLAKAGLQHNVFNELKAKRGEIYLKKSLDSDLYSVATNKDFASFYLIPRLLDEDDLLFLLNNIYLVFHHDLVIEEVDKYLEEKDTQDLLDELSYIDSLNISETEKASKKEEAKQRRSNLKFNQEWTEFREIQRNLEIEERKQIIINDYFSKINDSQKYSRLIMRKIEKEDLLNFYFQCLKESWKIESVSDLIVRNGRIFYEKENKDITNEINGFYYEWESLRYYSEKSLLSHVTGFVNYDGVGNYGLESFFNDELSGIDGFLSGEKGTYKGKKIIIDQQEYSEPINGKSLVLTIDYAVQAYVCNKMKEYNDKYLFDSGSISVMEPKTGKILALCAWPEFDANDYQNASSSDVFDNQFVSYQYEPGSIFKTITLAVAIDQNKVTPNTTYEDKGQLFVDGWPKPIKNSDFASHGAHGKVSMTYVLEKSLNTGAIFAAEQVGKDIFADYLKKFGFGERVGIELSGETPGNIDNVIGKKVKDINFFTASFGQGIAVTPLQMLTSYAALANKGVMMKPYIVEKILDDKGGVVKEIEPKQIRRVVSEETSLAVSAMLVNVVENGHSVKAKIPGYYIGGKTGTAQIPSTQGGYLEGQYIHSFVGYAPIDDPKFVVLVKFDNPKTSVFAEGTVVPAFGEIADFLLKYYQIPKNRE